MMDRFKTILILTLLILVAMAGIFWYGRYVGKQMALRQEEQRISSQIILDRISDQYFLVTKTVYLDSKAEIETPKRDDWVDLIKHKKITVRGMIRVDVGVDMKGLGLDDIAIDTNKKTISINIPSADILDSSLYGDLDVVEEKAILDKIQSLFKDTKNEDYNRAMDALLKTAKEQISSDKEIFDEAKLDSIKLIELIVGGMLKDYRVIAE